MINLEKMPGAVYSKGGRGSRVNFHSDPDLESKISEKLDPDPESLVIFGSSRSLCGLYQCHLSSKNIAEFWLHQWLPESEQKSDSQFEKFSDQDPDSKILE